MDSLMLKALDQLNIYTLTIRCIANGMFHVSWMAHDPEDHTGDLSDYGTAESFTSAIALVLTQISTDRGLPDWYREIAKKALHLSSLLHRDVYVARNSKARTTLTIES